MIGKKYLQQIKYLSLRCLVLLRIYSRKKLAGVLPAFSGVKDVVIVLVYVGELLAFLFIWDWYLSLELHASVINIFPGSALLAYLSYVAFEYGNLAIKNWFEKPSILNVLFSVIKVPILYYLFARFYIWLKS